MFSESDPLENGLSDESSNAPETEHSVFPRTVRMTLQILPNATRSLKFPHNSRILVGRADDEETANDLMLELSNYGGETNGVSRTHAAIHDQDGMVYITDLNSTNGTRINGLLLISEQPYRLREGDELQFGNLTLIITQLAR
ncbi:MAG: FHA domain-containing protein [Anaerolineaceae bacterium]|nr:FHA domain-containing protein [Anaerolineaceae bacterium]